MRITNSPNTPGSPTEPSSHTEATGPTIVDLGKQPRRRVKRLLKGEGKLMNEVRDCIAELRRAEKISASAEAIVIVIRQKAQKSRLKLPF